MSPDRTTTRHRNRRGLSVLVGLVVVLSVLGCGEAPVPSSATLTAAPSLAIATSASTAAPASASTSAPIAAPRCPDFAFDAVASMPPEFGNEFFEHGESDVIAGDFLDGLAQVYAKADTVDPCRWFTGRGWQSAVVADPRLREVAQGELRIEGDLVLRMASEGTYDLRSRPPVVPIDAIFDIAAGATMTDLPTRRTTMTAADERVGLHVEFAFDGHQWRADQVGPISDEKAASVSLPEPLPPGARCAHFVRDRAGAAFDDHAGEGRRTWCDADGRGRTVRHGLELVLFTRYPCETGHAAILTIGDPLGTPIDNLARNEFVRDPAGEFLAQGWVTAPYQAKATLPEDAAYSGWTNGNIEIWISPSEFHQAIYIKRGDVIERWPRAARDWGVIDCN